MQGRKQECQPILGDGSSNSLASYAGFSASSALEPLNTYYGWLQNALAAELAEHMTRQFDISCVRTHSGIH